MNEKRVVRVQLMLTDSELLRIDDWRFDNRVPSRSAAIRALIEEGIQRWENASAQSGDEVES